MGGAIPPGSLVHVRLVSPLSSATDHRDTPVRAVVSQPLFSSDHTLILPEGARLNGTITEAVPARLFGRNGQLRFTFRQLELTPGTTRKVEASLQEIEADSGSHLQLDAEGGAHAVTPKTNYVMPAIDVFLAATSLDLDEGQRNPRGRSGAWGGLWRSRDKGCGKPGIRGRCGQPAGSLPSGQRRIRILWCGLGRLFSVRGARRGRGLPQEHSYGDPLWYTRRLCTRSFRQQICFAGCETQQNFLTNQNGRTPCPAFTWGAKSGRRARESRS